MTDTHALDGENLTKVNDDEQPVDVEDTPLVSDAERFDSIGLLGKGGMGEVRLMRDRRISRYVAYKVLRAGVENDPGYRARFLLEARVQGQLEHPAIVPVHDLGETAGGELYFAMKCVRGRTLRQAIDSLAAGVRTPQYSRRRLLTAFSSVCLAVDFAHARGVVHRDLKPENVMLGQFGEVYVLDWGIAKVMHRGETPLADTIDVGIGTNATKAGSTLGTPKYMSPERQLGVANPQTDVFALGVILGEILAAHSEHDVPPELETIQMRASALDAGGRYPTARALHEALEQFLDGDRDLETRKRVSEEHARRAAEVLARADHDPASRTIAGQEIGRALGLDPDNRLALHTLMRMLTDVPAVLPPAAKAEMDRRWTDRQRRQLRRATLPTAMMLLAVPLILWLGVRNWPLFGAYVGLVLLATALQYVSANLTRPTAGPAQFATVAASAVLMTSFGLLGGVPAALAIIALGWRMNVDKAIHGLLILVFIGLWLVAPFVLERLGLQSPMYEVRDGAIVLLPKMNAFPPGRTFVAMVLTTFGAIGAAVIWGRLFINELRRAEHKLSFQAWQLQQLVPPER
ncbi:MAG TPA: serine/threonine-protein kinase [Kofleriaceae bacterium]|nr:serine/threonine-protein kinase [Kofleriaceae bacterium]